MKTLIKKLQKSETPYYVAVVPINEYEQVLIGLRKEDGIYTTPAGGANPGEQPEECAVRECFEEAGLHIIKERLEPLGIKTAPNGKPVHCFLYRTTQFHTHTGHDPDQECCEWIWTKPSELPKGIKRKKNQNRLETINEAYMKYHGLTKADKIPGGLADKKKPTDFDPKLIAQGVKVEMEHTSDKAIATEIAMDHLMEDLEYYDKLEIVEKSNYDGYKQSDNEKRKKNNTTDQIGSSTNNNKKQYTTSGSTNSQALAQDNEKRIRRENKAGNTLSETQKRKIAQDLGYKLTSGGRGPDKQKRKIKKSIQILTEKLLKGGEGSRGGKIIGHTRSGKPIYSKAKNKNHDSFTYEDHRDAAKLHGDSTDPSHQSWHHKLLSTKSRLTAYKTKKRAVNEKRNSKKEISDIKSKISVLKELTKGGKGSGKRGHTTRLDQHLTKLKSGAVLENAKTESEKPIFNNVSHATAHGYTIDDHNDAMNAHYELSTKWGDKSKQLIQMGHELPDSVKEIKDFHDKKSREHFRAGQAIVKRQAKAEKDKEVKKSVTQMGHHESPDLNTGSFANAYNSAKNNDSQWLEQLYGVMDGYEYGDEPRQLTLDKGVLSLVKVDDGQYTGFFKYHSDGMEDTAKIRIERINLPDLVQLLLAKEYITPMLNELSEDPATLVKEDNPNVEQLTKLELPEIPTQASSIDTKLEMLRLIDKLLN